MAMVVKLTGDTHGIFYRLEMWCYENPKVKNGVMVILGDAGINFHGHLKDREKKLRLQALPLTFFCVHGWPWFDDEQPSEEIKKYVESQLEKNDWKVDFL